MNATEVLAGAGMVDVRSGQPLPLRLEDPVAMTQPVTMSQASRPAAGLTAASFLRADVRFHRPTDVSQEPMTASCKSPLVM